MRSLSLVLLASLLCATAATAMERRALTADDINALREVDDPQVSPEGDWVAYTVRTADLVKDKRITHVWMASWDGQRTLQLTQGEHSEHTPRWSPDGKYVSFLTARGSDDEPDQVWLLDRTGGEASPLTGFNGEVVDYAWSPDGKKLALIVADEDPHKKKKGEEDKTPPPIVIDRFYFKEDKTGYLGNRRQHLYVFDVARRQAEILTPGQYDEGWPSWSPDGRQIAFFSKRGADCSRARRNAAAAHELRG
jgi:dipeptidyl aminopeptidase/acylaminoacyl peptidase